MATNRFPALRGALLALLAAALFGASTPLIQLLGRDVGPWMTAGLLYAGAALAGLLTRSHSRREAALRRAQVPRLLWMALSGAVIGPALLAWGLQHTSGAGASLMLALEAVFTVGLAHLLYREQLDRRVALAIALITLGGAVLVLDRAGSGDGATQMLGILAVLGATLAWGVDNTLSRGLADADPSQVVLAKAALGAGCSLLIAAASGQAAVSLLAAGGLLLVGASGYGLSLRFYLLAQRAFGAARTGSVFAAAPFIGAAVALALGERAFSAGMGLGAALMLAGVILHLAERHAHEHSHEALEHEHAHRHDDGHHQHTHEPMPEGLHSHLHRHTAMAHHHPHVPDLHHLHGH
ncbi:MAG: EamA family transporter [Betaproteobacteria bacterium]|nr:EamA family transporter [Betaproteobacteria bacterium]